MNHALRDLCLLLLLSLPVVAQSADRFDIVVTRASVKDGLISGTISVNGQEIGTTFENSEFKIATGEYKGLLRGWSAKSHAQGSFGMLAKEGDFLLEVADVKGSSGKARTDILFHGGTKPHQSTGCIMLGPVSRDSKTGVGVLPEEHPLRKLRKLFYGTENPSSTPYKAILITILDKTKK